MSRGAPVETIYSMLLCDTYVVVWVLLDKKHRSHGDLSSQIQEISGYRFTAGLCLLDSDQ